MKHIRVTERQDDDGSHSAYFTYDSNGYISKEVVDGVTTTFVRDGYTLLQERDGTNTITRAYLWNPNAPGGIGGLLEMKDSGGNYYDYLYDGKGNVSAVVDDSNNVVASYAYDPFGNLVSQSGTLVQPFMLSTKPYFSGFGLYDFGNRFYLPVAGKWLTMDPLREKGGGTYPYGVAASSVIPSVPQMNLYQFAGNNVVNCIDPFGLDAISVGLGGATFVLNTASLFTLAVPGAEEFAPALRGLGVGVSVAAIYDAYYQYESGEISEAYCKILITQDVASDVAMYGPVNVQALTTPIFRALGIAETAIDATQTSTDAYGNQFTNPPIPDASTYDANQMQDDENYGN